jgi:short-subunit dehydrogenase
MPAGVFARKALDAVARNEAIIVIPSWWKLFWWMNRLSPSWMMSIAQHEYKKAQKAYNINDK